MSITDNLLAFGLGALIAVSELGFDLLKSYGAPISPGWG